MIIVLASIIMLSVVVPCYLCTALCPWHSIIMLLRITTTKTVSFSKMKLGSECLYADYSTSQYHYAESHSALLASYSPLPVA